MFKFSSASAGNVSHLHPDLQRVFNKAIQYSTVDFGVQFPIRTMKQQQNMLNTGASKTMNSRHLLRDGEEKVHAGDVYAWVNGEVSWEMNHYKKIAKAMFRAAIEEEVQIEWGGHWGNPEDGPHWQLSWKDYP